MSGQPVVVLGAGHGRRMGTPKVFAAFEGRTFLERILERCRETGSAVTLVLDPTFRPRAEALLAHLPPPAPRIVEADGALPMLASLRAALRNGMGLAPGAPPGTVMGPAPGDASSTASKKGSRGAAPPPGIEPFAGGCWCWPVDAPFISPMGWDQAVETVRNQPEQVWKLRSGGGGGHPIWLPGWSRPVIKEGDWPDGLLGFLKTCPGRIYALTLDAEELGNFNTPEQLAALARGETGIA